jgi:hypothetical protein
MTRLRQIVAAFGCTLMVGGVVSGLGAPPSSAQDGEANFSVRADAASILIELRLPDAGLVVGSDILNAATTRAVAAVDSLGTSRSLAAAGYPGDVPFTLPGTVIGVASGFEGARDLVPLLPPVPDYPLAVQADLANPGSSTESGAFAVSATTAEQESTAEALLGTDEAGVTALSTRSTARATFDATTTTARSEAVAETNGMRIAGLLELSQRSTGDISVSPGGTPIANTDSFFGVSLVDSEIKVGFGPDGLTAAGSSLVDRLAVESVLESLAALGIDIEYLPETVSDDASSVTSAGLRVTQTFTVPDEAAFLDQFGLPFSANVGRVIVSITFGRVTLAARASTFEIPSFGSDLPTTPVETGGGSVTGPTPTLTSPPAAGSGGTALTPSPADPAGGGTETAATSTQSTPSAGEPDVLGARFYLVLVGAALAALASSRLTGALAVRLRFG